MVFYCIMNFIYMVPGLLWGAWRSSQPIPDVWSSWGSCRRYDGLLLPVSSAVRGSNQYCWSRCSNCCLRKCRNTTLWPSLLSSALPIFFCYLSSAVLQSSHVFCCSHKSNAIRFVLLSTCYINLKLS